MIHQDVREYVEARLDDGEEILWGEKTCQQTQDLHKNWFQLSLKKKRIVIAVLCVGFLGLLLSFTIPKGINNWGTSIQILLFNIFSTLALYSFLFAAILLVLNFLVNGRVYNIGAYGLTNKRLFEFDHDMNLIRHLDASRIRHVYGSEGVAIKPIGIKGSRSYQLGLMANSTLTINYIHTQLRRIGRVL